MKQPASFVIRVTDIEPDQHIRGQIEHVPSGTTAHFSDLEQANAFIRSHLRLQPVPSAPPAVSVPGVPVSSILSFLRRRPALPGDRSPADTGAVPPESGEPAPGEAPPPVPATVILIPGQPGGALAAVSATPGAAAARLAAAGTTMTEGSVPLDQALAAMLDILGNYLPPLTLPLPAATVSVVSVTERAVGLGNHRGFDTRGAFSVVALKGIRLDALVRFQLWGEDLAKADLAQRELNARLMADRHTLGAIALPETVSASFLRLALEASPPADLVSGLDAWRRLADYRVLFEYRYSDTDGAESLIARIPIHADQEVLNSPERETTIVTDEMVRWDNQGAPPLVLRGRMRVGSLAALAFIPGTAPGGTVTLLRTFDGAAGPPASHSTLDAFLAAIAGPAAPERHAQVTFASLSDFLAAFSAAGGPVILGDWNADDVLDSYEAKLLTFVPAIQLPDISDRLDISYLDAAFDQVAVVYLRVMPG